MPKKKNGGIIEAAAKALLNFASVTAEGDQIYPNVVYVMDQTQLKKKKLKFGGG